MKRVLAAFFACATLLFPGVARAHTHLERSTPAAGAVLQTPPTLITLVFSEAPQLAFTTITLTAPDGSPISLGDVARGTDDPATMLVPIRGTLAAGTYTVTWRTAAADGHPSHGTFTFTVQTPAAATTDTASLPQPVAVATHGADSVANSGGFNVNSPAFVIVRWAIFTAILLMVGVIVFRELVLLRWMQPGATPRVESDNVLFMTVATRRAARIGTVATIVLLVAALARCYLEAAASYGADAVTAANLERMLLHTSWGLAWMLQMIATLVAAFTFAGIARRTESTNAGSPGWALAIAAVLVVALTPALSGHALAAPRFTAVAVVADFIHVLAGGAWLGTLFALLVAGLPATSRLPSDVRTRTAAELVNTFSPLALVSAGTLVATGVIAAVIHLQHVSDLWQNSYGLMLLRKLVFVSAVIAVGAYNWLRARPLLTRDASDGATSRIRRSATLELTLGAIVIAITAILVATMPPHGP